MAAINYDDWALWYDNIDNFGTGESNRTQAIIWGVSEATIRRWKKQFDASLESGTNLSALSKGAERARKALSEFTGNLPTPMEFYGSPMITGDIHIPVTSQLMTAHLFSKSYDNNLRTLILGGDTWHQDSLGRFDPKQTDHTLEQEFDIGRDYIAALLEWFETIYIIKGNHDDRFIRALGWKLDFVASMKLILGKVYKDNKDRFHLSNLDHMYVYGKEGQKYYVNHPKAYSRTPLATGRALAAKHHCNIICAHAHHHAIGTDISGQYVVAEMGGLFDAEKQAYLREATTFPKQVNGLLWLDPNGRLVAWNPAFDFQT